MRHPVRAALAAASLGLVAFAPAASAAVAVDTSQIRAAVTPEGAMEHLHNLQNIATANPTDGVPTRATGTVGYDKSVAYVQSVLGPHADYYDVRLDEFTFDDFRETAA